MCDYSLEHLASRNARVADRLVSSNFLNTLTRGFAAKDDPNTAVCLLPGTELVFDTPPRYRSGAWFGKKSAPTTLARFRQINLTVPHAHHDALELTDGTIVPLTRLMTNQWATVLQLPSTGQRIDVFPALERRSEPGAVREPALG